MVAAKMGGGDPSGNARLAAVVEKARKQSVTRDTIERAIRKGAGIGGEKLELEHVVFEGYAPRKVPVIVEVLTDNKNRTAPEIRVLFKRGQLGAPGSNKFLFDHVGLVEAHHADTATDIEAAAIEAGAQEVESLTQRKTTTFLRNSRRPFYHGGSHSQRRLAMAPPESMDGGDERTRLCGEEFPRSQRSRSGAGGRIPPAAGRPRRRAPDLGSDSLGGEMSDETTQAIFGDAVAASLEKPGRRRGLFGRKKQPKNEPPPPTHC
jgi:hypothetical protein